MAESDWQHGLCGCFDHMDTCESWPLLQLSLIVIINIAIIIIIRFISSRSSHWHITITTVTTSVAIFSSSQSNVSGCFGYFCGLCLMMQNADNLGWKLILFVIILGIVKNHHASNHFSWELPWKLSWSWAVPEIDYLGQSKKTCSFSWSRLPGENMWLYCLMSCLTPCIPMLILRCLKIILKSEIFFSSGAKQGRSTTLRWRFFATPHLETSIFTSIYYPSIGMRNMFNDIMTMDIMQPLNQYDNNFQGSIWW